MIGIVLAGGLGSRLAPLTNITSKQLLPVFDKPMIYYPLTTLMFAGVREIFVIVSPSHLHSYQLLLGNGSQWGLCINYLVQFTPRGIADCFNLVPEEFRDRSCVVILGDNIFFGAGLGASLKSIYSGSGALALAYEVDKPSDYGVVLLNHEGQPVKIIEKPDHFVSKLAIPGLYWFDKKCYQLIEKMEPSQRGELEITQMLRMYLEEEALEVKILTRGTAWLDTGTTKNLLAASNFVSVIEERQGLKIGCPEEVAFREGFINATQLSKNIRALPKGEYRSYLEGLV